MGRTTIVVMGKLPVPGRVKTRIAKTLGARVACELYTAMQGDVFELVRAGAGDADCVFSCALDPEKSLELAQALCPPPFRAVRQGVGDLGARIRSALEVGGEAPTVVIGSDTLVFPDAAFARATEALAGTADAVFGPTEDGGYYLVAMKHVHTLLLEGIPWSTAQVMAATTARAKTANLELGFLPASFDLDHAEDLWRFLEDPRSTHCPRTRTVIERLRSDR